MLTESVHADTTEAGVHEAMRVETIHAALATKSLVPSEHLADAAYMGAELLVAARERHGIDLVGPQRRNSAWQAKDEGAFNTADFTVDWERQMVHCPEGKASTSWKVYSRPGRARGRPLVHARFHPVDRRACPSRVRCTRSASGGRLVSLFPQHKHEALAAARARERTTEYRSLYAQRQGIEATISQAVRAFGLRQARYRGLVKTGLQHIATAAAINLDRLAAWLAERPLAPTRTSRFAALAA
jgi:transposase